MAGWDEPCMEAADPEDPRLTVDGAVLEFGERIFVAAYADLKERFPAEPPPEQHADPKHPGLRAGEALPAGLKCWSNDRGAGWIAQRTVRKAEKAGKENRWFNARHWGSWRFAFLLARLQAEVWNKGDSAVSAAPKNDKPAAATAHVEQGGAAQDDTPPDGNQGRRRISGKRRRKVDIPSEGELSRGVFDLPKRLESVAAAASEKPPSVTGAAAPLATEASEKPPSVTGAAAPLATEAMKDAKGMAMEENEQEEDGVDKGPEISQTKEADVRQDVVDGKKEGDGNGEGVEASPHAVGDDAVQSLAVGGTNSAAAKVGEKGVEQEDGDDSGEEARSSVSDAESDSRSEESGDSASDSGESSSSKAVPTPEEPKLTAESYTAAPDVSAATTRPRRRTRKQAPSVPAAPSSWAGADGLGDPVAEEDPVGPRLTPEGAICDSRGRLVLSAYTEFRTHFSSERPRDEHPDPTYPGVRSAELETLNLKGLRSWSDAKGAGWIARRQKIGVEDKADARWFGRGAWGSWRLSFLLARLQRDVWYSPSGQATSSTGPTAGAQSAAKASIGIDDADVGAAATAGTGGEEGQKEWLAFTPSTVDPKRCWARTWNDGLGGQCECERAPGADLCERHQKQAASATCLKFGLLDGPIPPAMFARFQRAALASSRQEGPPQQTAAVVKRRLRGKRRVVEAKLLLRQRKARRAAYAGNAGEAGDAGTGPSNPRSRERAGSPDAKRRKPDLGEESKESDDEALGAQAPAQESDDEAPGAQVPSPEGQDSASSDAELSVVSEEETLRFLKRLEETTDGDQHEGRKSKRPTGKRRGRPPKVRSPSDDDASEDDLTHRNMLPKGLLRLLDENDNLPSNAMPALVTVMSTLTAQDLNARRAVLWLLRRSSQASQESAFVSCGGVSALKPWLEEALPKQGRVVLEEQRAVMLQGLKVIRRLPMTLACLRETGVGRLLTALRCYCVKAQELAGFIIQAWKDKFRDEVRQERAATLAKKRSARAATLGRRRKTGTAEAQLVSAQLALPAAVPAIGKPASPQRRPVEASPKRRPQVGTPERRPASPRSAPMQTPERSVGWPRGAPASPRASLLEARPEVRSEATAAMLPPKARPALSPSPTASITPRLGTAVNREGPSASITPRLGTAVSREGPAGSITPRLGTAVSRDQRQSALQAARPVPAPALTPTLVQKPETFAARLAAMAASRPPAPPKASWMQRAAPPTWANRYMRRKGQKQAESEVDLMLRELFVLGQVLEHQRLGGTEEQPATTQHQEPPDSAAIQIDLCD